MNNAETASEENRSLDERAYDLFGEMLLERETRAMLSEIEAENTRGDTTEYDLFVAHEKNRNVEKIRRYFARRKARVFFHQTLPKIGQVAAVVIATLTVAGGVAFAASPSVRVQVMKLLVKMEKQYSEISLVEDQAASFVVPEGWNGAYFPARIPERFALYAVHSDAGYHSVEYVEPETEENRINFAEFDDSTEMNIDTENAEIQNVMINGNAGLLSLKENRIIICWSDGREGFVLTTKTLDQQSALAIAESVTRIH